MIYSKFRKNFVRIFSMDGHIYIPKRPVVVCGTDLDGEWTMEKILNLIMRGILGTIAIYFINAMLEQMGMPLGVGINAATVLTSASLGFPGLLALYGIGIYKIL